MPRQYMQPQPGLFVGQSARQDMAQGRARADQERIRQQRLQGFQYTGQARQAARTQREAQRAAQQQMAMASRERDADRQFQMQRDAFGARRDYSMQERRIQSAAEQAQFGRDFEREQQETRFGQQQDLAMQEQDYRLQQLDIAAQDQFLSAEQQAEIQRERDMLVSDMQRDAAREGRFEQFAYGQMAAEEAARRPLSVAERQRMRFGDELSARQQFRGEDIATRGAHLQQDFNRENAERARAAKEEYLDLSTEAQMRVNEQLQKFKYDFHDREAQDAIWLEIQRQDAADESEERRFNKIRTRQAQDRRANGKAAAFEKIDNNPGLDPQEKQAAKDREGRRWDDMPDELFYGSTPKSRAENAIYEDRQGRVLSVPPNGPPSLLSQPPPRPVTVDGVERKEGDVYEDQGTRYIVNNGVPRPMGRSKSGEVQDRNIAKWKMDRTSLQRELGKTVKVKDPITKIETEQPAYTPEKAAQILAEFDKRWDQILNPPPPAESGEPGGPRPGPREEGRAAPSAVPSADTGQPTGDTGPIDDYGMTQSERGNAINAQARLLREQPPNEQWASFQKSRIEKKYLNKPVGEWDPNDVAIYEKAVRESPARQTPGPAPTSASGRRGSGASGGW